MNPLETIREEQTPFTRATECGGAHQCRTKGCRWTAFTVLFILLALPCSSFAQSALRDDADAQNRHTPNLNLSARAAALDRQQRQPRMTSALTCPLARGECGRAKGHYQKTGRGFEVGDPHAINFAAHLETSIKKFLHRSSSA
jgi:hypothetical protein